MLRRVNATPSKMQKKYTYTCMSAQIYFKMIIPTYFGESQFTFRHGASGRGLPS